MKKLITITFCIAILSIPKLVFSEEAIPTVAETATTFNPLPLDQGELSPFDGVLIDERTASELVLLRASDSRLRLELNLRQNLWTEQTTIYTEAINHLQDRVNTLLIELAGREPSWWSLYGGVVVGVIGFVVGAATTILITWVIAEAIAPDLITE